MEKRTISAKIPHSLYDTIQESEHSITECVEKGLNLFFDNNGKQEQESSQITQLLQERIVYLENQLAREQKVYDAYFLQTQTLINQKAIEAPGQQNKKWWKFWE